MQFFFKGDTHIKKHLIYCIFILILAFGLIFGITVCKSYTVKNNQQTNKNQTIEAFFNDEGSLPVQSDSSEPIDEKVAYLTFDDGPSKTVTPQILDILKEYNVKATFFTLGSCIERNPEILKREYSEGHKIANHSYSHVYKKIYSSVENLLNEINQTNNLIDNSLGIYYGNTLFRFPGGSFEKPKMFIDSVRQTGFEHIDWNCLGNDAVSGTTPSDNIIQSIKDTSVNKKLLIILLHDSETKQTTADALPSIIEYLTEQGYIFKKFENK